MQVKGAGAAVWLLGVIAAAQNPPNAPQQNTPAQQNTAEMSTRDTPATFSTKVNLVMVPVVVRDAKGKAIGTLQKEDFQLFDKGKPQVISRFSLEKAGEAVIPAEIATNEAEAALDKSAPATPAPAIAQRFVAYLFDDVHTST